MRPRVFGFGTEHVGCASIWQAANTVDLQLFVLVGYAFALPITFAYTADAYSVFRGRGAGEISGGGYG